MRLFLFTILMSTLLVFSGCGRQDNFNECADVDCSGHGTCLVEQGSPTCRCDPGYSPAASGWLCIDTASASPCAGITCSGHGTCVALGGSPLCKCNAGYTLSTDGLKCTDPCQGQLCSGVGTCTVEASKPLCYCPKGYWVTPDGKACESSSLGGFTTYMLTWDRYPTWQVGLISLDSRRWKSGVLLERLKYNLYLDSGGRGLHRTAQQTWNLTPNGDQVTSLTVDDAFTQSKVSRRRQVKASFAKGAGQVSMQRGERMASHTVAYKGSRTPLPMFGGMEFPGWHVGCFSPAFYALALQRYDRKAGGRQELEVFWPNAGAVGKVTVEAHPNWTDAAPVLHFPEQEMLVTFDKEVPREIRNLAEEVRITRYTGTLADLNLGPVKAATPLSVTAPPAAGQDLSTTITSRDGTKLAGALTLPSAGTTKAAALLMVPGPWAGDRDHSHRLLVRSPVYRHLAAHLAQAGYASLRYDPRGRGHSGGDAWTATFEELVEDADAARALLAGNAAVDATRIFVLSHGAGSTVALALLARTGKGARGYVGLAPLVTNLRAALINRYTAHLTASEFTSGYVSRQVTYYGGILDSIKKDTYRKARFDGLSATLWKQLLALSPDALLGAYPGPVLLVRGDQDLQVPADQLTRAEAAAQKSGRDLTALTLSNKSFTLAAGKSSDLWEDAFFPYELPTDAVTPLLTWLKDNK